MAGFRRKRGQDSGPAQRQQSPQPYDGYPEQQDYQDGGGPGWGYPPGPQDGYAEPYQEGEIYGAGVADGPPPPRLPWQQLLTGIPFRPDATFLQMRDYSMWGPALVVTFLYGLLAVFGLDSARETMLDTTAGSVAPYLLITGVSMVLGGLLLSTVTHNLARQFGGNGSWAPTAGFGMLIMSLTDVPRLAFAFFLGGAAPFVQILGWATWLYAGVLFTLMVSRSHEIPWPRALAASSIQLLALLMLVKLGTL